MIKIGRRKKVEVPALEMPKPATVAADAVVPGQFRYRCSRCGKNVSNPLGVFYKIPYSKRYAANGGYSTICRTCCEEMYQEYCESYGDERTAGMIMCAHLDFPFYHNLFDTALGQDRSVVAAMLRMLNGKQYHGQDFASVMFGTELKKTPGEIQEQRENKWPAAERRNKREVIGIYGYDPFDGYEEVDRRYLFNELVKYLDEDTADDPYKLSQILQVINNNNQIRKFDLQIAQLNVLSQSDLIQALNRTKASLVSSNDRIAKENEISVKNRSNKDIGRGTLTYLMKDLREKGIDGAEANFYDQLTSEGTQWAADMSLKAIRQNGFFDENDYGEMLETQRELIEKYQTEADKFREEHRLLLKKYTELWGRVKEAGHRTLLAGLGPDDDFDLDDDLLPGAGEEGVSQ